MKRAIDTAEHTLSHRDQHYTDPALHYALCHLALSLTHTHTQSRLNVLFTPESLNSPDTKPCLHISPTHTWTLSTHKYAASFLTLISPYKLNSPQLLSLHLLDFLFSTPLCSPPPLVPSFSTSSLSSVVQCGRVLASTVWTVTASPYFQPVTPWCPVGCCPVGIWCSESRILDL